MSHVVDACDLPAVLLADGLAERLQTGEIGRATLVYTLFAERHISGAKIDALRGEIETMRTTHDARVKELLEANNREVERRRGAAVTGVVLRGLLDIALSALDKVAGDWSASRGTRGVCTDAAYAIRFAMHGMS